MALLSVNIMEMVELILAVWRIGAVVVPINWRPAPDELIYEINHSDSRVIMFQDTIVDTIRKISPSLPKLQNFLFVGQECPPEYLDFEESIRGSSGTPLAVDVSGTQLTAQDIIDTCRSSLASLKKPKEVYFLKGIPRTSSGKLKRSELRDMFAKH